jgi:opacity protein-like surface antigen
MTRLRRCVLVTLPALAWTAAPAHAQWVITPYLGVNVSGNVEQGKGGPGGSVGYFGGRFGFEFDLQRYQHFFKDSEISPLDPAAPPNCTNALPEPERGCTDLDTDAMGFMGNVVVPVRIQGTTKWRPYGTAGLGLIRAWTNEEGREQNDFGFNVGGGLMYSLNRRVGLRGDLRYFRAFVEENKPDGVYFRDYDFLRVSGGVSIGLPR